MDVQKVRMFKSLLLFVDIHGMLGLIRSYASIVNSGYNTPKKGLYWQIHGFNKIWG